MENELKISHMRRWRMQTDDQIKNRFIARSGKEGNCLIKLMKTMTARASFVRTEFSFALCSAVGKD